MTGRRRHGSPDSSSPRHPQPAHTTRPDDPGTTRRDTDQSGGGSVSSDVDAIDTMADRLEGTRTRVDAVRTTVQDINVGPQSMGIVGSGFAGAAQTHLRTTEQHISRITQAVEQAQHGTTDTANAYRQTDAAGASTFAKIDTTTPAPTTRPQSAPTGTTQPVGERAPTGPVSPRDATIDPDSSISDRLNPPDSPAVPTARPRETDATGYRPSARELDLLNREVVGFQELNPGAHVNDAYEVDFADGSKGVYKPAAGEDASLRESIPGGLANREAAAYRLDEALGFDLIPTTTLADGHRGPGSLQEYISNADRGLDPGHYPREQQERMAVLDYVTGNTDRHRGNYLTGPGGDLVAIDHGYSFPEGRDAYGIRSDFVAENLNRPLSNDVVAQIRAADPEHIRTTLRATGLSEAAIDGAMARFTEIRDHGMITGQAWPGRIHTAHMHRVRESQP